MDIVDFGAGEGTLSMLLAQRAKSVIALDNSPKMVEYGTRIALEHGINNLEYRCGDMEAAPIQNESADLALFHQTLHHAMHPDRALGEAKRVLRPGGKIVIVDLARHNFEAAREMYGDERQGFALAELASMLGEAGFDHVDVNVVDRETEPPHFETILGTATAA
jgi:ArsR family transcriptional regulator